MTVGSQLKQTLANLKGVQGILRIYSIQSQDVDSRLVYREALDTADEVVNDLEERVKALEFQEPQYKGY